MSQKSSNVGRRTIRPNLYTIYGSARLTSFGASRSVQDASRRSRRKASKMGVAPKGICKYKMKWYLAYSWWELIPSKKYFPTCYGATL